MSQALLSSKVIVVEEEPTVRGVMAAPTSVSGAIGITERGPIGEAVLCTSFEEFQQKFGGFTPDSDLALAAMGFFENGGGQLWVVRTVHYNDVTDPESATATRALGYLTAQGVAIPAIVVCSQTGPFNLQDGDKIVLSVNGEPDQEVIFTGVPADVGSNPGGSFALTDGDTLTLHFEDGHEQTVIFHAGDFADIGAATEEEVAAVINAQIYGGKADIEEMDV